MIIATRLYQNKKPVWYPQFASWFIAFLVEVTLYAFGLSTNTSQDAFIVSLKTVQACRLCIFVALPVVVLSRRLDPLVTDEEASPLLSQQSKPLNGTKPSEREASYGSILTLDADKDSDLEDDDWKEEEEGRQKHEKRLEESGNWLK